MMPADRGSAGAARRSVLLLSWDRSMEVWVVGSAK